MGCEGMQGWFQTNNFIITPTQDVEMVDKGRYSVTGLHPQLTYHHILPNTPLPPAWFLMKFHLSGHTGIRPEISLTDEDGQVLHKSKRLCEVTPKGMVKEFITIPKKSFSLRIDLPGKPNTIVQNFSITKVSPLQMHCWHAWLRLRLALISPNFLFDACGRAYEIYASEGWKGIVAGLARDRRALGVRGEEQNEAGIIEGGETYQRWFENYGVLSSQQKEDIRQEISRLPVRPTISILIPIDRATSKAQLAATIASITRQIYPAWELLLACDETTSHRMQPVFSEQDRSDDRIRFILVPSSDSNATLLNSALQSAKGQFTAFLRPGDVLTEDAFFWAARAIGKDCDAAILYSDEDATDESGNLSNPYCKPDWNPPLFYCQNFLGQLALYRLDLVRIEGGFRKSFDGDFCWDLALRIWSRLRKTQVVHIPKILCHRLSFGESDRDDKMQSPGPSSSEALLNFFTQRAIDVAILPGHDSNSWRVQYVLKEFPKISIIIPTYNALHLIRPCLESIFEKTCYPNYEVIVVDNRSDDPDVLHYLSSLEEERKIRVLHFDEEFNFSAINNFAVEQSNGQLVCLMNNDIQLIDKNWLQEMASQAMQKNIGAVGAKLYYPDNTIQHCGVVTGIGGVAAHLYTKFPRDFAGQRDRNFLVQNVSAVTAACLVIKKAIYQEVGGFEEKLKVAYNDIDFCLKVKEAGYDNIWTPFAELYHHESVSRGHDVTPERYALFKHASSYMRKTWGATLRNDPYYNINLTLKRSNGSLAWPPREYKGK